MKIKYMSDIDTNKEEGRLLLIFLNLICYRQGSKIHPEQLLKILLKHEKNKIWKMKGEV